MAGVKGKSGGARPGAGRKKKEPAPAAFADPLDFLREVWQGNIDASATQVRAAQAALPFLHQKLGESGKKEKRNEAAKGVASRFAPAAAPKLVAAGGKKV